MPRKRSAPEDDDSYEDNDITLRFIRLYTQIVLVVWQNSYAKLIFKLSPFSNKSWGLYLFYPMAMLQLRYVHSVKIKSKVRLF